MEMQHPSVSPLARWAQNVYVALAGLILLGIFTQGLLIGTVLFGGSASGRQAHGLLRCQWACTLPAWRWLCV